MSEPPKPETFREIKDELTSVQDPAEATPRTTVVIHSELPYAPASRFQPGKVKKLIKRILKDRLGSLAFYDFEQAPSMVREIADTVKNMGLQRYKIVVQSVIGETKDQGFQFASKSMWDPETDDQSFGTFMNDKVFGVVGVWAIYLT